MKPCPFCGNQVKSDRDSVAPRVACGNPECAIGRIGIHPDLWNNRPDSKANKDSKRMDWLEQTRSGINFSDSPSGPHCWRYAAPGSLEEAVTHFHAKTYREAIDLAAGMLGNEEP